MMPESTYHPAAAAAVGRPDRHSGEVPVAYVVPAGSARLDEAELLTWATTAIGEPAARPDAVLAGRTAVLTARHPDLALAGFCRRHGLILARISSPGARTSGGPGTQEDAGRVDVRLVDDTPTTAMQALTANPALAVIVRPDRVIAAAGTRGRLPHLPWHVPATAARGHAVATHPSPQRDPAGPLPTAL